MGITLAGVDDALVDGNRLSGINMEAIKVFGGTNLSIRANYLTGMWTALGVSSARGVTISENTMEANNVGVEVFDTTDGRAFHNNFIHSGWYVHDQARGGSTTNFTWDDGYPSGGNYWSDDTGFDRGGDGIGDEPYVFAYPGGVDRYPLILPWGRTPNPPVARLSTDNPNPVAGQGVWIGGTSSTDEDGSILVYHFDFGDGVTWGGIGDLAGTVSHSFANPGTYTTTLTVTDNSGLTNSTSMVFTVTVPTEAPRAYFDFGPLEPRYPDTTVFFSAEGSSTRYGTIVSYVWDFGDGGVASGDRTSHVFRTSGTFQVRLTVTNSWGHSNSLVRELTIASIPDIPLVMYSHPSGFRLPVPSMWARSENEKVGGTTIAVVLRGPEHDNFRTNILVDAIPDSTLREDRTSMERLTQGLLDELRKNNPTLIVTEGPTYRTVSNHSAVVFAVRYESSTIVQKAAVVVSAAHQTGWLILLSVSGTQFILYNATFERMIDGFVITAAPPAPVALYATLAIGAIAALVAVFVVVYAARRRHSAKVAPLPLPPPVRYTMPIPPIQSAMGTCLRCGSRMEAGYRFCSSCGSPVGRFFAPQDPLRRP
ncbi:MAG: PKD domain-containing protein [Methanobacteriota archaeon]|nr:MAG: PKD domain-containing protein [Euryarchaeota archaeon]